MGRKKRPKRVVSSFVLGLFLTLIAIYAFKGELLTNKPSFTRRELFTVQKDDISMMLDPSEMLSPSIPPLLDTQNAPHGAPRLAPDAVENQAPNIPTTKNDSRVISPSNQIAPPVHNTTDWPPISPVASPPGTIQAPLNSPPSVNIPSSPRINWTPPVSSPPRNLSTHLSPSHRNNNNNHNKQPVHNSSSPSPKVPVAEFPKEASTSFSSSPTPVAAPPIHLSRISPSQNTRHAVSPVPTNSRLSHHNNSNKGRGLVISPAPPKAQNASSPITPPSPAPKHKQNHHASPPVNHGPSISTSSPVHAPSGEHQVPSSSPVHAPNGENSVPSSSPVHAPNGEDRGVPSPSPVHSSPLHHKHKRAAQVPAPAPLEPETIQSLPPPPPNQYCTPISCPEPYTNSPPGPGSPCICVIPIKVGVRLSVSLYTFFSLVSSLAQEIAAGVKLKQIQVRVMGANSATGDSDKTDVLIDLVPLGERFDNITALLIFDKFWRKQVVINANYFGDYQVLYVLYPGLPPSPPAGPLNNTNNNNGLPAHPFAADVRKKDREKQKGSIIAIIVLSSVFALILFFGVTWFVILKLRRKFDLPSRVPITPSSKQSIGGTPRAQYLSPKPPSTISNPQNNAPYKLQNGTTFTLAEISDATNNFDESKLIGEGGFGRVFEGVLGDAKRIAVKVLKRDDGKEFFAEVEMLGRLHHRNLVKLIGICVEGSLRCLVYELVPNGSVESHLYGAEKEVAPLDWDARIKIALGAARALAYLHEDSSPRVIHRDFKSSNILLEHDFTPKVSDFGLARAALGEGNDHISTRVMGTFGYVAPEYAMTGHLLVKSDVYSYGVVLLELLTGLKPVDMLRPPGQENLVTWALPLLSTQEGLNCIIDSSLTGVSFDSLAKVAAIASMCVQPEVDQRPFMGEVVQVLKLVLNENNNDYDDECCSLNNSCNNDESLDSESFGDKNDLGLFGATSASPRFGRSGSGSFRMGAVSGPLRAGRSCRYEF